MHILYILEPARAAHEGGLKAIVGKRTVLTELRTADGPWYPDVISREDSDAFNFCAGRWHDLPDFTKPAHFPDGCWLGLRFDRLQDTLIARSDPFLMARWYYAQINDKLYLSNSLRFLKQHVPETLEPNWPYAQYLLRFGYLPGKHTPLKHVYSLRSGETLCFRDGQITISQADLVPPTRKNMSVAPGDIRDVLAMSVQKDVGQYQKIVLPISGGMDSRVILGLALRMLPREAIQTVTFGHQNSLDLKIGQQVARALNVPNIALPMDERPLAVQAAQNFETGEGMFWSVPEYPVTPFADALPEHSLILSGYIGDVVFGSFEPDDELKTPLDAQELLLSTVESVPYAAVRMLLPFAEPETYHESTVSDGQDPLRAYESFIYGSHQMNRTNFALFVQRHKCCYATPFVHANVLELAYSLSANDRRGERAFFRMVREFFPELWSLPLKSSFGYPGKFRHSRRTVLIRAWRKMLSDADAVIGARVGKILYRHPRLNYAHPREWLAEPHREYVLNCFARLAEHSPLEKRVLMALRKRTEQGKPLDQYLLKGIVTLAQWDEHYGVRA